MLRRDCQAAHAELLELVGMDLGAIGSIGDRIQKLARLAPELTALCELSQPQRMRRLLIIKPVAWGELELRWAKAAIGRIRELNPVTGLKKIKSQAATLALACYGVRCIDLEQAMQALETAAAKTRERIAALKAAEVAALETAVEDEPGPVEPAPAPIKVAAGPKVAAIGDPRQNLPSPQPVLHSLEDIDEEELDPETLAELAALKAEVALLGKRA